MEDSDSKLKRIKRFFLNKNYKIKEYLKWYKIYDNKKYFVVKQKILNFLMIIFMFSIGILSIFLCTNAEFLKLKYAHQKS